MTTRSIRGDYAAYDISFAVEPGSIFGFILGRYADNQISALGFIVSVCNFLIVLIGRGMKRSIGLR